MSEKIPNKRPNCREILNKQDKWCLTNIKSVDINYLEYEGQNNSMKIYINYHLHLKDIQFQFRKNSLNIDDVNIIFKTMINHSPAIEMLCDMITNDFKSIIKSFYIFNTSYNNSKETQMFVNIKERIFGIGYNRYGVCGQGHDNDIDQLEIIPEVFNSHEKVEHFFNGLDYVLCLTSDSQLFSWGKNDHGQLGIGCADNDLLYKPQLIQSFVDVKIVQVCCGERHSLVLTEEGVVYGWGDNCYGQTGVGLTK